MVNNKNVINFETSSIQPMKISKERKDLEKDLIFYLRYIKAIKEARMICSIGSVSKSGMSRTIKFLEMSKGENRHFLYNFYQFFDSLGYTKIKDSDYFRIGGCGMDMIFHTNYTIMHDLRRLGFINKEECDTLAQATPHIV